jgi:hypothetical protein
MFDHVGHAVVAVLAVDDRGDLCGRRILRDGGV